MTSLDTVNIGTTSSSKTFTISWNNSTNVWEYRSWFTICYLTESRFYPRWRSTCLFKLTQGLLLWNYLLLKKNNNFVKIYEFIEKWKSSFIKLGNILKTFLFNQPNTVQTCTSFDILIFSLTLNPLAQFVFEDRYPYPPPVLNPHNCPIISCSPKPTPQQSQYQCKCKFKSVLSCREFNFGIVLFW